MPVLSDEERVGSTVDTYRLGGIIGRGGMGTVFEAVHTWTQRKVAVKFLHPEYARNEEAARRFLREAQAAASLHHPNVVDVLDMGQDHGGVYIVLEFLEGESLRSLLLRQPRLGVDETLQCLLPVLDALQRAHGLHIVHRDLKPENIFLSLDGKGRTVPKLLDFGIAKIAGGSSSVVTSVGAMLGTPAYMAPEQVSDTPSVGITADVWAIGVVMYECLSGSLPFNATNPASLFMRIMTEEVPQLRSRMPELSAELCAVVQRALMRDPTQRYASAEALANALRDAVWGGAGMHSTPAQRGAAQESAMRRARDASGAHPLRPWSTTARLSAPAPATVAHGPSADAQPIAGPVALEARPSGSSSRWSWSVIRKGGHARRSRSRWVVAAVLALCAAGAAAWLRVRTDVATDVPPAAASAPVAAAPASAPSAPTIAAPTQVQEVAPPAPTPAPPLEPAAQGPAKAIEIVHGGGPAAPSVQRRTRPARRAKAAPSVDLEPAIAADPPVRPRIEPARPPARPEQRPAPAQAAPKLSEDF